MKVNISKSMTNGKFRRRIVRLCGEFKIEKKKGARKISDIVVWHGREADEATPVYLEQPDFGSEPFLRHHAGFQLRQRALSSPSLKRMRNLRNVWRHQSAC